MTEPEDVEDVGEPRTDEEEFDIAVEPVVFFATPFLDTFFGERCSEFELECECCKRWAAFDVLVENPFVEEPKAEIKAAAERLLEHANEGSAAELLAKHILAEGDDVPVTAEHVARHVSGKPTSTTSCR